MIKRSEYEIYNYFLKSNFPKSVYITSEDTDIKKTYYSTINKLIELIIIYRETNLFSESSTLLFEEIRILLNKMLLYVPLNDSFILSSIIRILAEKYLKLIISISDYDIDEKNLRNLRFTNMKEVIKETRQLNEYTDEIEIIYSIFNEHSQIIHDKHNSLQTLTFLDEQITRTTIDIKKYTRVINNFWKIEFKLTLTLSNATNQDFSLAHKTRLKKYLSEKEFVYISFL